MRITVRARPGSKTAYVKKMDEPLLGVKGNYELMVAVKEPAKDGKANRAIEKAVAEFFRVPPSQVRIVVGHTMRTKIIEIG